MREADGNAPEAVGAFRLRRRFYMWGRWLRHSSLYPTWVVRLIHKDRVRYVNRGHAETQEVKGEIRDLETDLIDENLKGVDEWFERQNRYSRKDAEYELREENKAGSRARYSQLTHWSRRAALKRLAWRLPARGLIYFLLQLHLAARLPGRARWLSVLRDAGHVPEHGGDQEVRCSTPSRQYGTLRVNLTRRKARHVHPRPQRLSRRRLRLPRARRRASSPPRKKSASAASSTGRASRPRRSAIACAKPGVTLADVDHVAVNQDPQAPTSARSWPTR